MRIKKKNQAGNARNFITRTQAVKKLQVSLADFRRLCIFKGIYPREPKNKKKANKGSTAPVTFYYYKDIQYLLHEPVLAKFREHKTFAKKLQKALSKGEISDAKKLNSSRPKYTLDHIIKERYPSFLDALRDIDDALNMLFLFANMPTTDKVNYKIIKQAENLCNQWLAYIAKEKVIKKVFVSIKGVYYQVTIKGQEIRWLVPFKFPQNIPSDVDFRIMLTFLEFYSTLLNFVLFRLYTDANLIYPPVIDFDKLKGIGGLSAYVLESSDQGIKSLLPDATKQHQTSVTETKLSKKEIAKALKADSLSHEEDQQQSNEEKEENVENIQLDEFVDNNKHTGDILLQPSANKNEVSKLFERFVFLIGREVPLEVLELLILSCGGRIVSEAALDELLLNDSKSYENLDFSNITHQISDKPIIKKKTQGRTYVQPQWIFDSINKSTLLNASNYAPGETLPPHLSPWGDAGGYDPEAPLEELDEESDEEEEEAVEEEDEVEMDDDLKAQKELELEVSGVKYSEAKKSNLTKEEELKNKKRSKNASDEKEEKELKMIMMSNKQRKLYKKMQYGIDKQESRQEELKQKRRKIEKTKSKLENLNKK